MKATVFVDDAVLGRLPPLCAKTGKPADGYLRVEAPVHTRGTGALLLLLFLGPLGWIVAFLAIYLASETVRARVPMSAAAVARQRFLNRARLLSIAAAVVLLVMALDRAGPVPAIWSVFLGGAIVAAVVFHVQLELASVHIRIDGSRRWITISRVHPAFARAVRESLTTTSST